MHMIYNAHMKPKSAPPLKITSARTARKPTKHAAYEENKSFILAHLGLQLHQFALSKLHCKPSREKWLNTPEEGNAEGQFYKGHLAMTEPDTVRGETRDGLGVFEVDLTRDEYVELKAHLAFLRRIRPYEKHHRR
jgi:hypothetical protein